MAEPQETDAQQVQELEDLGMDERTATEMVSELDQIEAMVESDDPLDDDTLDNPND